MRALIATLVWVSTCIAAPLAPDVKKDETYYSERLAQQIHGKAEHRLFDGSRVDIVTDTYAIEVDWAHKSLKWAEAIGQARYYARVTGKRPGVVLLRRFSRDETERANIHKCIIAAGDDVRVWVVDIEDVEAGESRLR